MYSIRRRLGLSLFGLITLSYALVFVGTEIVIRRDRFQRHERLVMATTESIINTLNQRTDEAPVDKDLILQALNDFSATRVLVWLSRPGQDPLFPTTISARTFLDRNGLLLSAGVDADGMQKPRSFAFEKDEFYTCSMPLPGNLGVLRFLEDVGVNPANRRSNLLLLFGTWLLFTLIALAVIQRLLAYSLRPLSQLEQAMDEMALRPSGNVAEQQLLWKDQPSELQPIAQAFNDLSLRLQDSWTKQQLYIRSVSHELTTPLALIRSSARLLKRRLKGISEQDRDLLLSAENEAFNSERLVRMLTDLARSESGNLVLSPSLVYPFVLLEEMVANSQSLPWAGRLQFKPKGNIEQLKSASCLLDKERLRQCLNNLIENSAKYSPHDQPIILQLSVERSNAMIRVSDFGPGIPFDERDAIFQPFYRATNASTDTTGSGIGLALVAKLVHAMGGEIEVLDQTSPGTTMQVKFPLSGT